MTIDWDSVVENAENTPRGMLAELLGYADEIENLIVIFHTKDGAQHVYQNTASVSVSIAMMEFAKWCELKRVDDAS